MIPNGFRTDSKRIPQDFLASRGHAHPQPVPYPLPTALSLDPIVVVGPLAWVEAFTKSVSDRDRASRLDSRTTINLGCS
jgi:hypothetical protein